MASYSIFACNEEGVAGLQQFSQALLGQLSTIKNASASLLDVVSSKNDLGPHRISILNVIKDIIQETDQAEAPVSDIANKLNQVAKAYQGIIDADNYQKVKHR